MSGTSLQSRDRAPIWTRSYRFPPLFLCSWRLRLWTRQYDTSRCVIPPPLHYFPSVHDCVPRTARVSKGLSTPSATLSLLSVSWRVARHVKSNFLTELEVNHVSTIWVMYFRSWEFYPSRQLSHGNTNILCEVRICQKFLIAECGILLGWNI